MSNLKKNRLPALLALAVTLAIAGAARAQSARTILSFDNDWRFNKGDVPGSETNAFNDSAWRQLNVPHDWAIEGPFEAGAPTRGSGGFAPSGVVWYRKSFPTPQGTDKRVFINFDGVMEKSDVYINGQHLGKRPYGYIPFQYDMTGKLKTDGTPNILAVRADTSQ
jgi:beta-galactosidase